MAGHWRILQVLGFFDCSWAELDVDRGRLAIKRNVLELANLPMEGYFRALYAPLGGSPIWREKASLTSTKLSVSMFSDKSPCMPLYFGTIDYTACKTWENSNFLKKGKTVISVKPRNFSRSQMTKQISPLESSRKI